MKNLSNSAQRCNGKSISLIGSGFCTIVFAVILLTGCKKENSQPADSENLGSKAVVSAENVVQTYTGLSQQTMWELQQARAASAKYLKLENALKDGYIDINVIKPNMGYHYMKPSIVDGTFDVKNPEILVYNKDEDGNFHLQAVEYAIPLANARPEGFTGSDDVWDGNVGFNLWLLHAWVWTYNPDGAFNPTNPLVHLH